MYAMFQKNKRLFSSIALIFVAMSWGTSYAFVKTTVELVPPFTLLAVRFGLSSVFLTIIYCKRLRFIDAACLKNGGIIGLVLMSTYITSTIGIQYTTASKSTFLIASSVLIVPFLVWAVQRKKPDKFTIIGVFAAMAGIALLTFEQSMAPNKGDILSLMCAVLCAVHMLVIDVFGREQDAVLLTIVQFIITTVTFLFLAVIFENIDLGNIYTMMFNLIYLALISTVFTYVVLNSVQRYVQATTAALILSLESVFGTLFAAFYINEKLSLQMVIGCAIIFAAIITQETKLGFIKNIFRKGVKNGTGS